MDMRVIGYFLTVAREENITKAAQLLHISQPTLSRQLMQLEEELGVKLFKRSKHSVLLTSQGMLFRRRAQELVNLAHKAKSELTQSDDSLTGEITIGCGELLSMDELSKIMAVFSEKHPFVRFHLQSAHNSDIKDWLEDGTLDFGLLIEPVDIGKYGFIRMAQKERWGALVRKDSPLATLDVFRPGNLVGTPLITVRDDQIHNALGNWSGEYASQMTPVATYNLLYNATTLVKQNMGVAVCIRLNCEYDGLCFVPFEPNLELSSVLAWKERQTFSTTATALIQFLKNVQYELLEIQNKH